MTTIEDSDLASHIEAMNRKAIKQMYERDHAVVLERLGLDLTPEELGDCALHGAILDEQQENYQTYLSQQGWTDEEIQQAREVFSILLTSRLATFNDPSKHEKQVRASIGVGYADILYPDMDIMGLIAIKKLCTGEKKWE